MGANSLNLASFDLDNIFYHTSPVTVSNVKAIKLKVGQMSRSWPRQEREINRSGPNSSFANSLIILCFISTPIIKWR